MERFRDRLIVFAMRRLGDHGLAEDAAQETLRRVIEALEQERIVDPAPLPAFVFQTAKHVCQQWQRKRGREQRALDRYAATEPAMGGLVSSLDELVSEERRRNVADALQQLAGDDRHLLQWLYGMGLSNKDVADRLRLTEGAVRVRRHRALKRLAELLGNDETFTPRREPDTQ